MGFEREESKTGVDSRNVGKKLRTYETVSRLWAVEERERVVGSRQIARVSQQD